MNKIKWCFEQKRGLSIIEPNENMVKSYLIMAEESIKALENLKENKLWSTSVTYYIFYYSLYSLMLKIGIKSEIHDCSLEFMQKYLTNYYDEKDIKMINDAFKNRINLQYYADRIVDANSLEETKKYCIEFYLKTKEILIKITESDIKNIRKKILEDIK